MKHVARCVAGAVSRVVAAAAAAAAAGRQSRATRRVRARGGRAGRAARLRRHQGRTLLLRDRCHVTVTRSGRGWRRLRVRAVVPPHQDPPPSGPSARSNAQQPPRLPPPRSRAAHDSVSRGGDDPSWWVRRRPLLTHTMPHHATPCHTMPTSCPSHRDCCMIYQVALPSETTSGKLFLQLYVEHILALQGGSV